MLVLVSLGGQACALVQVKYPAPGDPVLARHIAGLLRRAPTSSSQPCVDSGSSSAVGCALCSCGLRRLTCCCLDNMLCNHTVVCV